MIQAITFMLPEYKLKLTRDSRKNTQNQHPRKPAMSLSFCLNALKCKVVFYINHTGIDFWGEFKKTLVNE